MESRGKLWHNVRQLRGRRRVRDQMAPPALFAIVGVGVAVVTGWLVRELVKTLHAEPLRERIPSRRTTYIDERSRPAIEPDAPIDSFDDLAEISSWLGTYTERLRLARTDDRERLGRNVRCWDSRLRQRRAELA